MVLKVLLTSLIFIGSASADTVIQEVELPALQVNPNVTVSGISSGAFFAIQMHLAHSEIIQGVGSVAGGPWNCSQGSVATAQLKCMMDPSQIDLGPIVQQANAEAGKGKLAPLENLNDDSIYIFNSPVDGVVKKPAGDKLRDFYLLIAPQANIKAEQKIEAAHGFPTLDFGNECAKQGSPWMQKCGVDTAGEIMTHLFKGLSERAETVQTQIVRFNQEPFRQGADLLAEGFAFIPKACSDGSKKCRLHVAFHGCLMNADAVGEVFATRSGYNNWAETNDIIVLYPQADRSMSNPNGCWDWYGSTTPEFANRKGPQVKAIKAMIDHLMSAPAKK